MPLRLPAEGDEHEEAIVNFFGEQVAFPMWSRAAEARIRRRVAHLHLTEQGKTAMARAMIIQHLEELNDPYNRVYPNARVALREISNHVWRVARARGIVAEI
jgi:hypothetical protein